MKKRIGILLLIGAFITGLLPAARAAAAEVLTSQTMVEQTIQNGMGKVSAESFDYELLMGSAEGELTAFTHSESGENIAPKVADAASVGQQLRFISSFQLLGGKGDRNVVFRITPKENTCFSIAFNASSDWASGYLRTVLIDEAGTRIQLDRTDIKSGTAENPYKVSKTVTIHMKKGQQLLFYFGHETEPWQVIYFTAAFTSEPEKFDASAVPSVPSSDAQTLTSGQMVLETIQNNYGTVNADYYDYELLMGNVEGFLEPFTHSTNDGIPMLKDAEGDNPGRIISSVQVRGGMSEHESNVVFRLTAKANIKLTIQFEASSDWATGYFKTIKAGGGTRTQIDRTDIPAGTPAAPCTVSKLLNVQLSSGDVLLFCFGNDSADWQTVYFSASFCADPAGYVAPEPPHPDSLFDLEKATQPLWQGSTVYNDTICFMENSSGAVVSGNLLYTPDEVLSVRSADLQTFYEEGVDYQIAGNKLVLTEGSRIPVLPRSKYCQAATGLSGDKWLEMEGNQQQLILSHDLMKYQISVTYTHSDSWAGMVRESQAEHLAGTIAKLKNKEAIKIVFYGDSITAGWDASGQNEIVINRDTLDTMPAVASRAPFTPTWAEMVTQMLRNTYGYDGITKVNRGAGGSDSAWGKQNAAELVAPENPDLVIIGFGMNETWRTASEFKANLQSIIDTVHQANPNAEFLLVSSMMPNRDAVSLSNHYLKAQEDALYQLQEENGALSIGVVPVHSMYLSFDEMGKLYTDYSSNNVNHPNDFSVRVYAQMILSALEPGNSDAPDAGQEKDPENNSNPSTGDSRIPALIGRISALLLIACCILLIKIRKFAR